MSDERGIPWSGKQPVGEGTPLNISFEIKQDAIRNFIIRPDAYRSVCPACANDFRYISFQCFADGRVVAHYTCNSCDQQWQKTVVDRGAHG